MPSLDLKSAQVVNPSDAPVDDSPPGAPLPAQVSVGSAQAVVPVIAPVSSPLSGIAKAGVELTKWVLVIICVVLIAWFTTLVRIESAATERSREYAAHLLIASHARADSVVERLVGAGVRAQRVDTGIKGGQRDTIPKTELGATPPADTVVAKLLLAHLESERATFRAFWMDTLKTVLLNVLFPVLTALLGYIFGSRQAA